MLLTVVLLVAVFGLASDNFLDPFNIINILRSIAIVTVIAIGVSISSVGSTASLANALVISCLSGMARDHRSDSDNPVCDSGRGNDIQLRWVDYRKHGAAERRDGGGTIPAAFGALGQVPTIVIIMLVVTLVAQLAVVHRTADVRHRRQPGGGALRPADHALQSRRHT